MKTMQARNEGIERDVQRFKDRKKIEQEVSLLSWLCTLYGLITDLSRTDRASGSTHSSPRIPTDACQVYGDEEVTTQVARKGEQTQDKKRACACTFEVLVLLLLPCYLLIASINKTENWRTSTKSMTRTGIP
jgi:hypothetical protein